jgi:hypothetical protein
MMDVFWINGGWMMGERWMDFESMVDEWWMKDGWMIEEGVMDLDELIMD